MSLANDYFLLFHGKHVEKTTSFETYQNRHNEEFLDIASLILTASRRDFEKFINLESFQQLVSKVTNKEIHNLDDLHQLQHCLIDAIEKDITKEDIDIMHKTFEYLQQEQILSIPDCKRMISLFDPEEMDIFDDVEEETISSSEDEKSFKESKVELEAVIADLQNIFNSQDLIDELNDTQNYLNNQKFSIGITGVMNAGKSTMLNALMGQEILGSAVVPETANLTIVKYDAKPSARVFYWNTHEWNRIEKTADEIESIKEFVKETKTIFGEQLDSLIQEESVNEEVDINSLAKYTSAEASGKKCNLVKYVELKSDLNFLEDGIEIVDTPGLDDPVIQREEITKEYLSQCDLMIHLMNVSQSATLKDVEFIIDALLYQNITKLLIVITRADMVSKEQLQEVIEYTKTSISNQLKAINKDSQLDYILKSIKFVPISGKMALLHRTGRSEEALNAGYKIEDTGILEIESYLQETLFGKNSSKSELIIKGAKTQLSKTIEKELKTFNYELILLSKSKEELEEELEKFNAKKNANEKIFKAMREDISMYKNDAKSYLTTLDTFLETELLDLQQVIKQRVFNDVKYSYEKTNKKPQGSRIKTIVETAIKDGIIDVIRDYRYKFIKKSQTIGEISEQKYHEYGFTLGHKNDNFDAMGFFQDDFKSGFLTTSNDVLISKIVDEVSKSSAKKLAEFDRAIEGYIKEEFEPIENNIKDKANKVAQNLIEEFFKQLNEPLSHFEQKLKKDEETLQNRISTFEENENKKDELTIAIHKKIKRLETVAKGLKA